MKITRILAGLLLSVSAVAQTPVLTLNQVGSGFTRVTTLANAGDDRLFVCEKGGIIKFFRPYVGPASTTFMDINSKVINPTGDSDERGLLGLTFDPNFATNRRFYVNYINNSGNTVVARYTVSETDPNVGVSQFCTTINRCPVEDTSSVFATLDFAGVPVGVYGGTFTVTWAP
jgi:hypothetical protein